MTPSDVNRQLRRQDGVITRGQANALGLTDRQVSGRVRSGEWTTVHPAVFRRTDRELSVAGRSRAALLWAGDGAVLSGVAAAHWSGMLSEAPRVVEIVVPRERHPVPRSGIRVIRRQLEQVDVRRHRGISVLDLPMAALTAAVALGDNGPEFLDRQLQNGLPLELLQAAGVRQAGWHGADAGRRLVALAGDGAASAAERLLMELFRKGRVTGWVPNTEVFINGRSYHPDFSFERQRLAVEVDGWAWHHTPDRFRADRSRDADFLLSGWRVLRFTWYDLTQRPASILRIVGQALALAS